MAYAILLAIALSIDTFVLAISIGFCMKTEKSFKSYRYVLVFGLAQAGLFALGRVFSAIIPEHLIFSDVKLHLSAIVFTFLAVKMFIEFFKEEELVCMNINEIGKIAVLTSIDALIVGITPLSFDVANFIVICTILTATVIASYIGMESARKLKNIDLVEKYSLLIGSTLLLILAIKSF